MHKYFTTFPGASVPLAPACGRPSSFPVCILPLLVESVKSWLIVAIVGVL